MTKSGYEGFDVSTWYGVFMPAGTPKDIVVHLNHFRRQYSSGLVMHVKKMEPVGNRTSRIRKWNRDDMPADSRVYGR